MTTNSKAKPTSAFSEPTSPASARHLAAIKTLLLDIDEVSVVYSGQTIVESVSMCLHTGEFIGLIGPNGAGKTTLLKVLLGLIAPASGQVRAHTKAIGYVPQRGNMADSQIPMSVMEVVRLGSRGDGARAAAALERVHLTQAARQRFATLSGGQQQRVLIAKALAGTPALLVLDEPTTGIDARSQAEFFQILQQLQHDGITIVLVSHDVDAVLSLVDRVICLNQTVLYDGLPEHFEADQYLPKFYGGQHRILHHQHEGAGDAHA